MGRHGYVSCGRGGVGTHPDNAGAPHPGCSSARQRRAVQCSRVPGGCIAPRACWHGMVQSTGLTGQQRLEGVQQRHGLQQRVACARNSAVGGKDNETSAPLSASPHSPVCGHSTARRGALRGPLARAWGVRARTVFTRMMQSTGSGTRWEARMPPASAPDGVNAQLCPFPCHAGGLRCDSLFQPERLRLSIGKHAGLWLYMRAEPPYAHVCVWLARCVFLAYSRGGMHACHCMCVQCFS
jgi:hypothetical protein